MQKPKDSIEPDPDAPAEGARGAKQVGLSRVKWGLGAAAVGVAAVLAARAGAFSALFSSNYLPHRYCYLVQPGLVWTNVSTDALIGVSYALIFGCLSWIALSLRRVDGLRKYLWIFVSFGLFIVACGATHFMEVITVWVPVYPLSAAFKVLCAAVSVPTAIYFAKTTPAIEGALAKYIETLDSTKRQRDVALFELGEARMLVDVADYAIFLLDPTGLILTWNLGAERIKGYTANEAIGKHFSIFYPEDVRQTLPAQELEAAAREGRHEKEGWRIRKDGSKFWAQTVLTALRREDGSLAGFSKVTQDRTRRRTAEAALGESNARTLQVASELADANSHLNNILDASRFVSIIATDPQGIIKTFNRGAELMLGYSAEELVGKHSPALFHVGEEVEQRGAVLGKLLNREIHGFEVFTSSIGNASYDQAEWTYVHKDGHHLIVNLSLSAIPGADGCPIGYLGIAEDVTVRQRTARELAAAYASLNAVLDCTSDGVMTVGRDWTILYGNRNAMETVRDVRIGGNYWTCFPEVANTSLGPLLHKAMEERCEIKYEVYYEPYQRWFKGNVFPVEDGVNIFFTDITEEKQIQEQLDQERLMREKRIEALSHMAGGLAHEISNPLAIIHGRALDLKELAGSETAVAADAVRTACQSILKTANRATGILRGLRGFAREASHDPMELASIAEVIDECLEMQQSRFERHHVEVRLECEPDLPLLLCRETQVGQIVTNLLNNAFDAITQSDSKERWITVNARLFAQNICIDVVDSGPGIEDHFKQHLMEPFFTTKEMGMGMGVGLSLSRAIAQDHNGSLTLCSGTEHTCFRLVLPLDPTAAGLESAAPEGQAMPKEGSLCN